MKCSSVAKKKAIEIHDLIQFVQSLCDTKVKSTLKYTI